MGDAGFDFLGLSGAGSGWLVARLIEIRQESAGGRSEAVWVLKRCFGAILVRCFRVPCGISFFNKFLLVSLECFENMHSYGQ